MNGFKAVLILHWGLVPNNKCCSLEKKSARFDDFETFHVDCSEMSRSILNHECAVVHLVVKVLQCLMKPHNEQFYPFHISGSRVRGRKMFCLYLQDLE